MSLHAPCAACGHVPAADAPVLDLDGRCPRCGAIRTEVPPPPLLAELVEEVPAVPAIDPDGLREAPPSGSWVTLLLTGAGAVLVAGMCLVPAVLVVRAIRTPPRLDVGPPDHAQARREVAEAFAAVDPPVQAAVAGELNPVFAELGAGLAARDGERLANLMDAERMFDACAAHGLLHRDYLWNRSRVISGMRPGMVKLMEKLSELLVWTRTEIRAVRRTPDGGEVCVIARHRNPNGGQTRMRWWLVRRAAGWKVYDLEDLEVPGRLSMHMAMVLQQAPDAATLARVKQLSESVQAVNNALVALAKNDTATAEAALRSLEGGPALPANIEALRQLAHANLGLQQARHKDALEAIERVARLQPDMPALDLLRGMVYSGMGDGEKALRHLDAYRTLLGDDAIVLHHRGEALRHLSRFKEAAVAYRASLDDDPTLAESFIGLVGALGGVDDLGDIPARFEKLPNRKDAFITCVEDCIRNKNHATIDLLTPLMRKADAALPALDHYLALARAWQRRAAEAVPLFRKAQAAEKDAEWREAWRTQFLTAMAGSDRPVLAYAALDDGRAAFADLAAELKELFRTDDLRELIAVHARKHADDPALPMYRGEVLAREGAYAAAEKEFAAGAARPVPGVNLADFLETRVLTRFHTAGPLDAYRTLDPSPGTFDQLANLILRHGRVEPLAALIEAHEKDESVSPQLPWFRCRLAARQGRVAASVNLLKAVRAKVTDGYDDRVATFLQDARQAGKLAEAYRAYPEAKGAFEGLAEQWLDDDNRDAVRELVKAHRAVHPDDVAGPYFAGQLLSEDGKWADAAAEMELAWRRAEGRWKERLRSSLVWALYRAGRLAHAYDEVGPRDITFSHLTGLLRSDRDGARLQRLVAAERHRGGDSESLRLLEAHAAMLSARSDRALSLFARSTPGPTDGPLVMGLVAGLTDAGRGAEAYRLAKDRRGAFAVVAHQMLTGGNTAALGRLVEEHRAADPADPVGHRFEAELYLARGDGARADQALAAAVKSGASPGDWNIRQLQARAHVLLARTVATYRKQDSSPEAFHSLANACMAQRRADELAALVAARSADVPDDPGLAGLRLEVLWLKGEHGPLVRAIEANRPALSALPSYRWILADRLVRSLIRLGRTDQALQEATRPHSDLLLLVLAHAARGDARNATAVIDRGNAGWLVPRVYTDSDLGPLVRGPTMAAFRQRWPGPKGGPGVTSRR